MHWCQQLPISTMDIWSWNEKNDTLPWTYHMTIIDCQMISIKVYVQVRDTIKQVPNSPESQVKLQHWSITAAIWVRFGFREEKHPNKNWQSSKLMTQGFQHGTHWTMINHKKHPSSSGWSFHPANCSAMRTGTKKEQQYLQQPLRLMARPHELASQFSFFCVAFWSRTFAVESNSDF